MCPYTYTFIKKCCRWDKCKGYNLITSLIIPSWICCISPPLSRQSGLVPHALSSTSRPVRAAKSVPQPDLTHTSSRYCIITNETPLCSTSCYILTDGCRFLCLPFSHKGEGKKRGSRRAWFKQQLTAHRQLAMYHWLTHTYTHRVRMLNNKILPCRLVHWESSEAL